MSPACNRIRNQWRDNHDCPLKCEGMQWHGSETFLCVEVQLVVESTARVNFWLCNMKRGQPALRILFILCVAVFCLGIRVDAYVIPFSFANSADIVNKVCLHPCREIGLEKGTRVTVDFTFSNTDSGSEGDYISQLLQHFLPHRFSTPHQKFRNPFFLSSSL